ncbi:hypothetical protein CFP56_025090 [Quercus suber]|uniref:Uncharacterized protein n=1 Tax=Quercus suber TaxID=58331 RepID=A0AAW0K439_QUESU
MILIKLFKLNAITLKQRLMVKFFIIFTVMLTLRLLKESLIRSARLAEDMASTILTPSLN